MAGRTSLELVAGEHPDFDARRHLGEYVYIYIYIYIYMDIYVYMLRWASNAKYVDPLSD